MDSATKADLIKKLEEIVRPNETLGRDLLTLLEREGYRFDRDRIQVSYGSEKLYCTLSPTRKIATVWVAHLNNLTVQALNFSAKSGFGHELCLCVKDIMAGIDKNTLNNPPSDRIFGLFVEWVAETDLEANPNVVFELLPDSRILRMRETPEFWRTCFSRYLPVNFKIEDLAALLLVKKDLPKTKAETLRLFMKKESFLEERASPFDRL